MPSKPILLLLHGALGSAEQFDALSAQLKSHFEVVSYGFSGHGGKGSDRVAFTMESLANELEQWLLENSLKQISVFGYSMGGYVALLLASRSSRYFTEILTLGTKFDWTPAGAAQEVKRLQPAVIEAKLPQFASALADRHQPLDWRKVMENTADMMLKLGENPLLSQHELGQVQVPVSILLGGEDKMVSQAESQWAAQCLPNARSIVLPQQPHPLEQVEVALLAQQIKEALQQK